MSWAHYLVQVNIYLIVFYAFYRLLLDKETYFMLNRVYLITSGFCALCIPYIRLGWLTQQPVTQQLSVSVGQLDMMVLSEDPNAGGNIPWGKVIAFIYVAGVVFFLIRFFLQLYTIKRLGSAVSRGNAYSFFNRKSIHQDLPSQATIHKHEDIHIQQLHSLDVLFFEFVGVFNWFNPVVYLYKTAVKNIHEFLADEEAASFQGNKEQYALLLLSSAFRVGPNSLTNSFFNQSLIKNRIYMLHKEKSKKAAILKYGLYLPLFSGMLLLSSASLRQNESIKDLTESIPADLNQVTVSGFQNKEVLTDTIPDKVVDFVAADTKPSFQGGLAEFYKFLGANIKYPKEAYKNNVQGKVFLSFIVEKDGSLNEIKGVAKPLGSGTDEEAIRVLKLSPKWNPGKLGDKPVRVQFNLPISFALSKKSASDSIPASDTNTETANINIKVKGKVENIKITNSSNGIGQLSSILTLDGTSDPVYIVDGLTSNKATVEKLNPRDVESVEVQKANEHTMDKRASNGVVRITMKKS